MNAHHMVTRALGEHESARAVDGPNELRYVQMKRDWKVAHRGASPEQYDEAIRLIVAECEV